MKLLPTRTTGLLRCSTFAVLLLILSPVGVLGATSLEELQTLGVQIKLAADRADAGSPPDRARLSELQQELERIASSADGQDERSRAKFRAVSALFSRLSLQVEHSPSAVPPATHDGTGAVANATQRGLDVENVRARHGDDCRTALGVSAMLPVRVTLAAAGAPGADAWFHFIPAASGHFRFSTDSVGADPMIEVSDACGRSAHVLARNDDDVGLDASATVFATAAQAVFVHVKNSASGGIVILRVDDANGSISGTVSDAASGLALAHVTIDIFNAYGGYYGVGATTDLAGHYSAQVLPGNFYVRAHTANPYLDTLYPSAVCAYASYPYTLQNCPLDEAQLVSIEDGTNLTGVDIAMTTGFRLAGALRDNANQPLSGSVTVYNGSGTWLATVNTDYVGHYSIGPMPQGAYKAAASANGHGSQLFDQIACSGSLQQACDTAKATPIAVTDKDVVAINFNLPLLARIEGAVTAAGGQPITGGFSLGLLDEFGNNVSAGYFYGDHYDYGPLAPGKYYVYASAARYFSQLFDGVDCSLDCSFDVAQATEVTIDHDGQVAHADFQLDPLPQVHGHIQDAVSGLPLPNVSVAASSTPPANFSAAGYATTNADGDFVLDALRPGAYYVWAQSDDHVDEVYPDLPCEQLGYGYYGYGTQCDVSGAVLLTIARGQIPPALDFSLTPSSAISGRASTRIEPGADLPALVEVDVYNGAGAFVGSANADLQGNYVVGDLPPAKYFPAAALNGYASSFIPQLWQNVDCPLGCAPTTGSGIDVPSATTVADIDFSLLRRDAIVGRITDDLDAPISGVLVDLFEASTRTYVASAISDAAGYYAAAGATGNVYFVGTEAGGAYIDQVYSGIACPSGTAYFGLCALTYATPVAMTYAIVQPRRVDFHLQMNDVVFANGFD